MKTLLLAATLLAATGAVAAPTPEGLPPQNPFAAPLSPYEAKTPAPRAQQALEDAIAAASTEEEKAEVLMKLGVFFVNQKRYEQARDAYQRALALPFVADSPQALSAVRVFIAQSYDDQGKWQNAIDVWAQIVRDTTSTPVKVAFEFLQGQAYNELKQPDRAAQQLELVRAQMTPVLADQNATADERAFAFNMVGKSYQVQDKFDAARQSFESVSAIADASPDSKVTAFQGLAEVAEKQGRAADAKAAFASARSLVIKQADKHFEAREWDDAIESYREAAQIGTPNAYTVVLLHWDLAGALSKSGDIDGARVEFQAVIDATSEDSNRTLSGFLKIFQLFSYQYLAEGYMAQGKTEMARAALNAELAMTGVQEPILQKAEEMLKSLPPKS